MPPNGLGPVYSGKTSYGLTDFALDLAEHNLFDVFCSAVVMAFFSNFVRRFRR
jgi:hypothetical protein